MVNLEALANELRDRGENYVEVKDDRLTLYGGCAEDENDDLLCGSEWIIVDDTGDVWTGDDWPDEVMPVYPYLAIIAQHLGAGQPIAADRAALVERIGVTAIAHYSYVDEESVDVRAGTGNDGETWGDLARSIGEAAIAVIEDAGWGPRAEPVAPPEPLSAGEIGYISDRLKLPRSMIAKVLAALPARFAAPVEGA